MPDTEKETSRTKSEKKNKIKFKMNQSEIT